MEKKDSRILFVFAVATSMLLSIVTIAPANAQTTTIGVEPKYIINGTLHAGSLKVEVWVRNVVNLMGVEFKLSYDTSILTATVINYGGIFGDTYWWTVNGTYDAQGWLNYGVSQYPLEPTFTGDGRVANITFTIDSPFPYGYGSCPLHLYETILGDDAVPPNLIDHTAIDGLFDNRIPGDITGPESPPGSGKYPYDGKVDTYDLAYLGKKFGTSDAVADFTGPENPLGSGTYPPDGTVNTYDLAALGKNFGKHYP